VWETEGKTIAWKRNLGVSMASHPIIVHMDDDDIYPPNSILFRVAMLMMEPKKECSFCTTLPCYDIKNYISFVNVPPARLPMSMRVSEATLTHTKGFWEAGKFEDAIHIAEGNSFIRGREHKCREISPQDVIVSLVHPRTTSSRKAPAGMESNGCHYGFSEELFTQLSTLGQEL
jgi:glycosyltransferase involved in cell wall biosynthesis